MGNHFLFLSFLLVVAASTHVELLLEDKSNELQGNINSKWYCLQSQFNSYIMSLLHPVPYQKSLLCKLPSHDLMSTYDVIIIEEVKELKKSRQSFDVQIPNAESISSLLSTLLPEQPDHLLYCLSSYQASCPSGFEVIQSMKEISQVERSILFRPLHNKTPLTADIVETYLSRHKKHVLTIAILTKTGSSLHVGVVGMGIALIVVIVFYFVYSSSSGIKEECPVCSKNESQSTPYKIETDADCIKELEKDVERYNGEYKSDWILKIQQYRQKENEQTKTPSPALSIISSSSLENHVLISGKSNAIIADKSITSIYTNGLAFLCNTYALKVEGKEYKINDVIIRFGVITVSEKLQGYLVIDFEYLPSGSYHAFRILDTIRGMIHPQGKVVSSPFFDLFQRRALDIQDFSFKDLAQTYAGIVDAFKKQ